MKIKKWKKVIIIEYFSYDSNNEHKYCKIIVKNNEVILKLNSNLINSFDYSQIIQLKIKL